MPGATGAARAVDRVALLIATAFGAGYSPVAPGTAGSAVALLLLWLIPFSRVGLVLFRVFDVVKPPPARASQRLSGGVGVMIDDLIAGLYALAVLAALRATLGWP